MIKNLSSFIEILRREKDIIEIDAQVDPVLELSEIHRRVIAEGGPALLFKNPKGSDYPVITNLFGTKKRVELAFGKEGRGVISKLVKAPFEVVPPTLKKLWNYRDIAGRALRTGYKSKSLPANYEVFDSPQLTKLPVLKTWPIDGGRFFTLPLVYTEDPLTKVPNLGMYRMQLFNDTETGMHFQIGKGGGYHLKVAEELGRNLNLNMFLGGPPLAILGAIMPLPENVPELLFSSFLGSDKIGFYKHSDVPLPMLAESEFCLSGEVIANERRDEGPFGDHYGYYSLTHPFPVFKVNKLIAKKGAIYPATVVGKPPQEDLFIGDYLQELLSPIFPIVMPTVLDLWSYGETGYHSLAAAVVRNRYKRECIVSAFRILGEGQLSLTKFLLLTDKPQNLKDFKSTLTYILERADFRTDLYIFSNLSMDTLDYTGPRLNEGSRGVLIGVGEKIRDLKSDLSNIDIPRYITGAKVYSPGCIVISVEDFKNNREQYLSNLLESFFNFQLVIVVDDVEFCTESQSNFLWNVFTRFEPAADIHTKIVRTERFHNMLEPPILIDATMKEHYPPEVEVDDETRELVNRRWSEYFPKGAGV